MRVAFFVGWRDTKSGCDYVTLKKSVTFVIILLLMEIKIANLMKKFLLLITTTLLALGAMAQPSIPSLAESSDSDLQARFKASMEIPLSDKWSLTWGEQLRLKNTLGDIDKVLSSLTLDYEPWRFLEVGTEYAFVNERKGADDWRIKHRINFNVTGKLKLGRFDLSLRERIRFVVRSYDTNEFETPDPFTTLRTRLKAATTTHRTGSPTHTLRSTPRSTPPRWWRTICVTRSTGTTTSTVCEWYWAAKLSWTRSTRWICIICST